METNEILTSKNIDLNEIYNNHISVKAKDNTNLSNEDNTNEDTESE